MISSINFFSQGNNIKVKSVCVLLITYFDFRIYCVQAFQHPLSENPGTDGYFKKFIRMGFQHEKVHVEVCRAAAYFAVDLLYPHVRLHDFGVRQRMPLECFSVFYRLLGDTNFFVDDIVHDEIRPFI